MFILAPKEPRSFVPWQSRTCDFSGPTMRVWSMPPTPVPKVTIHRDRAAPFCGERGLALRNAFRSRRNLCWTIIGPCLLYSLQRFWYGLLVTRWSLLRPDSSPPFLPAVYLRESKNKCKGLRGSRRVSECARQLALQKETKSNDHIFRTVLVFCATAEASGSSIR